MIIDNVFYFSDDVAEFLEQLAIEEKIRLINSGYAIDSPEVQEAINALENLRKVQAQKPKH